MLVFASSALGQTVTKRALFLGNSYTAYNNLPQLVADAAASVGDVLLFGSNTPGGYTLQGHSTNATSQALMATGTWDYVVLQEQSQAPSFPLSQVEAQVFPFAALLDDQIHAANPCAETVFFMTWGRKNGDASNCATWPPVCTYAGMDSLLNLRYRMMAEANDAILSPVGAVWRYIRTHYPTLELYQSDESHPSAAGSYAAACSFYAALFRKDPTTIAFNSSLPPADAALIRDAAKAVVFDSLLEWHIGAYDPAASFTFSMAADPQVAFANTSAFASSFVWDFGDGETSTEISPVHTYINPGTYTVQLIATACERADTALSSLTVPGSIGLVEQPQHLELAVYPNPVGSILHLVYLPFRTAEYRIVSVTGSTVASGKLQRASSSIDVAAVPEGTYILQLQAPNGVRAYTPFIKAPN
jgi:hypothetical protein